MSSRLDLLSDSPRNAETRLDALLDTVTSVADFYVRSNFPTPRIDPSEFELEVVAAGDVTRHPLPAIRDLPPCLTRTVTLECAGNGRTLLRPLPDGTPWTLGATGTASFTGIPLASVLPHDLAGAVELIFTGADRGRREGWGEIPFQRSLPVDVLQGPHPPMLAWAMNGEPLTPEHGAPLRLVVPGWYAVASVKWLVRVETVERPFEGCFQTDRYRYLRPDGSVTPVRHMRVRSLLLAVGDSVIAAPPPDGSDATSGPPAVRSGPTRLRGIAWSGHAAVEGVEISTDGGTSWAEAHVERPRPSDDFVRVFWSADVELPRGDVEVVVRARDTAGNVQPLEPWSNELGYGNNVVQRVRVRSG
jgi:DMSO/TMAO reductase YedYZ molybdopterin-dependent catalytic subunit